MTVGIGGNDAGIAGAGMDCLNLLPVANPLPPGTVPDVDPLGGCKEKYAGDGVDRLSQRIRESEPKLVRAFQRIHELAPNARILAIDYLALVPDHGCYPTLPATDEDMAYIHAKFLELNAMVRSAAARRRRRVRRHLHPDHRATTCASSRTSGTARRTARRSTTPPSAYPRTPTPPAPAPRPRSSSTTCGATDRGWFEQVALCDREVALQPSRNLRAPPLASTACTAPASASS